MASKALEVMPDSFAASSGCGRGMLQLLVVERQLSVLQPSYDEIVECLKMAQLSRLRQSHTGSFKVIPDLDNYSVF